jgi:hypothetical protein
MTLTESPPTRPASRSIAEPDHAVEPDHGDSYLLRLCLDLQLDAALLTLGAAAQETLSRDSRRDGGSVIPRAIAPVAADPAPPVPWRRWLNEDVDTMCALAASLTTGPPVLPSSLEVGFAAGRPAQVLAELLERYEAIRDVLVDVLSRPVPAGADPDEPWRSRIRDAFGRCQARLQELGEFAGSSAPVSRDVPARRGYLPGELLG